MKIFQNLRQARRALDESGGVLLNLDGNTYTVTDFEDACEQRGDNADEGASHIRALVEWDETRLRHRSGMGKGRPNDDCPCPHHRLPGAGQPNATDEEPNDDRKEKLVR